LFDKKIKINQETDAFRTYQRIIPFFKDMLEKDTESPSQYWTQEISGFDYMFDASPLIINKMRHHCYHLTGERDYAYRDHHLYKSDQFKSKLELLDSIAQKKLFISEPNILGGFGFRFDGKMINKDTLKFYECMIALERSRILDDLVLKSENFTTCEIGGGWGGFAYHFCSLFPKAKYVLVDLPQTLIFSYIFLTEAFPNKKVKLYEYEEKSLTESDILLIPNGSFEKFSEKLDLGVNICSFQEMTTQQIVNYVKKLSDSNCKYMYSLNRNLNKNNDSLDQPVELLISKYFDTERIEILGIPYSDLNIKNLDQGLMNKDPKILLKNLIKLMIKNKKDPKFEYLHTIGKKI